MSAADRREHILRGALGVFARRGYGEASMSEIARAAGITPAVIYDHFPSKAALHITLLQRETDNLLSTIASALGAAPDDAEQRLRVGVDAFFGFVEEHSFAWRMIFRDPPTDPKVAAAYRKLGNRATDAIRVFIEAGAPVSMLSALDAERRTEMFAQMLSSGLTGLAYWWYDNREVPRELVVDRVLELFWTGLEKIAA